MNTSVDAFLTEFGATAETRLQCATAALRGGRPVLLVDDAAREDEVDVIFAAENIDIPGMAWMIRHCSGIVCLALTPPRVAHLQLPMMVVDNSSRFQTGFTVSIEASKGVTTGVSAFDRVLTIKTAIADHARPEDLARPGHIFPLRAAEGGVLERPGHTEGSVDLVRLAGLKPCAVLCELMNDDGTMARGEAIRSFALEFDLPVLTIADVIQGCRGGPVPRATTTPVACSA